MSGKGLKLRGELVADLNYREEVGAVGEHALPTPDLISAVHSRQDAAGRVLIPRPEAGGASNDAPPAVRS
jgi:hypothetical protein